MLDFRGWIERMQLVDHKMNGSWYTWWNRQEENPIARRIDRVLVNGPWLSLLSSSSGRTISPGVSDHCGLLLTSVRMVKSLPKPFKYFKFWRSHPQFEGILTGAWDLPDQGGDPFYRLSKRLKILKKGLMVLNRTQYSDISARTREAEGLLAAAQQSVLLSPSSVNVSLEKDLALTCYQLQKAEESFYRQKSRVQCVVEGDFNTTYFHNCVKTRAKRQTIDCLLTDTGAVVDDVEQMGELAVSFYRGLIGSPNPDVVEKPLEFYNDLIMLKLNPEEADSLCTTVTREEIKSIFCSMAPDKAPGPDGFPSDFYKAEWGVVGRAVEDAELWFFQTKSLPQEVNSTILSLVPKVSNVQRMKDFRPIACCNVLYKGISKLLANRLAVVLPKVISTSQSAFVKGRLISDNILMASELVKDYHRKTITPRCMVKIDIMKAFDSVDWKFLFQVMRTMGFPDSYIELVQICVTTPKFSVSFNGGLCGYFSGGKGLRQGDPLSPYLFTIAMEVFSCLMKRAVRDDFIPFHPRCKYIGITHLCFADDVLVFTNGSVRGVDGIKCLLDDFYCLSGLRCNPEKSQLFCGGITDLDRDSLSIHTGFSVGALPVRYLGVPLISGKLSRVDCQVLVDRITARIRGWQPKLLSYAGRLQLISSVISSVLQYWMNIFLLPASVLKDIEAICNNFLWGVGDSRARGLTAWQVVAVPKAEGGLGVRDFRLWNKACIVRHLWNILAEQGSLWVAWVTRYRLRDRTIWEIAPTAVGSWIWKRILKLRDSVLSFVSGAGSSLKWDGLAMARFSVKRVWHTMRVKQPEVEWAFLLWGKYFIPKHSVLVWLIIHNRIVTKDKLFSWGKVVDQTCMLCPGGDESRDHLFAECSYFQAVLRGALSVLQVPNCAEWLLSLQWAVRQWQGKKSVAARLEKLVWVVAVSSVWKERCSRLYGDRRASSPFQLVAPIKSEIGCLASKNIELSVAIESLYS
ncbi:unnamed protein product [Linum trigynum]|uniref:Reverse transcriptase domain-containing protein n=1 Tax=Linum trigynum TaxID=586398 RepID=A0AAV2DVI2_9ROSI